MPTISLLPDSTTVYITLQGANNLSRSTFVPASRCGPFRSGVSSGGVGAAFGHDLGGMGSDHIAELAAADGSVIARQTGRGATTPDLARRQGSRVEPGRRHDLGLDIDTPRSPAQCRRPVGRTTAH
jgi:hypothetical protein